MENLKGKTAVLYPRVSTTDQKLYGNSLKDQRYKLENFCIQNGISILKTFEEDYSAKDFNRPVFNEMHEFIRRNKKNIDYVLVNSWDRFGRNAREALVAINLFKNYGVEVNSIEQWIDHDDPTNLLLLLMNLGMPEVDNRNRSNKVIAGMRRAQMEGRWVNSQPKGYIPGKDEFGRTLMKPDPVLAPIVTELFKDFASGNYSQNELIKMSKYRRLHLTKSNLSRMLTQIAYAGKIRVKAYKNEPEQLVEALHEPLISMEIYDRVQHNLGMRSRYKQKSNRLNQNLPLRGFLKCPKCGGNLTGSASTSKTGAKHFYYHCNPRKGCNSRFPIQKVHDEFFELLKSFVPAAEVCDLFKLVLNDYYQNAEATQLEELKKVEKTIEETEQKQELLMDKLLSGIIKDEEYQKFKSRLDNKLRDLRIEKSNYKDINEDIKDLIDFGVHYLKNYTELFDLATVEIKQKMLSSILEEKLVFTGEKYRTPIFKDGFRFIMQEISKLEGCKIKTEDSFEKVSRSVLEAGLEPARA